MERDRLSRDLVERLEAARMTAEALSLATGLARDTVGRWIRGATVPTLESLRLVEAVLSSRLGYRVDLAAAVGERRAARQSDQLPVDGVVTEGFSPAVVAGHASREGASAITATPLTTLEAGAGRPGWGPGLGDQGTLPAPAPPCPHESRLPPGKDARVLRPEQVADRKVISALARRSVLAGFNDAGRVTYRRAVVRRCTPLELARSVSGQAHTCLPALDEVFIPQHVTADPPMLDLPKDLRRRLAIGDLTPAELPDTVDPELLVRARADRACDARTPVLDVVTDPEQRLLVLLGEPGTG